MPKSKKSKRSKQVVKKSIRKPRVKKSIKRSYRFKPTGNEYKDLRLLINTLITQLNYGLNICTINEVDCHKKSLPLVNNVGCDKLLEYSARKQCENQRYTDYLANITFDFSKMSKTAIESTLTLLNTKQKFADAWFENTFMDIVGDVDDNAKVAIEKLKSLLKENRITKKDSIDILTELKNFENKLNQKILKRSAEELKR